MKSTKRQLRSIIRESLIAETTSHERVTGLPSEFVEDNWLPWLAERGLSADDLDDLAQFTGAPDRSWLSAAPPADGMDGPADLEFWARNKKTGIKESKMKITKRQLRRIIREEKTRLLTEGAYLHEILDEAATALEYRDGDAIERLSYQVSDLMIGDDEKSAYERALNAMAEAAYELQSYEEG